MKSVNLTIAKNSLANVLRGGASAILVLALPPFLIHLMDHERFAAWALILQVAAYVNFLDFGLQFAVGRFFARDLEKGTVEDQNRTLSTAFYILAGAGASAYLLISLSTVFLPVLFPGASPQILREMHFGILSLAAFYALNLPLSTFTGALVGLQRNEYTAFAAGGTKLLGGLSVVLAARYSHSLVLLATLMGGWQLLAGILQYCAAIHLLPAISISTSFFSKSVAREIIHYCSYMSVWLLGGFLVNGLDLVFVSHFDFNSTGYYAIATNLNNFVALLNGSIFNAMLPAIAVMHARKQFREIGQMVLKTTRYGVYGLVVACLPFFLVGRPLLRLWVGAQYADNTFPILVVLLCSCIVRWSGNPYAVAMMGTSQHRHNAVGTMIEGCVNVVVSLWSAHTFGAIGVAYGTLVGSFAGLLCHIYYNIPRTNEIQMSIKDYSLAGLFWPAMRVAPLALLCVLGPMHAHHLISTLATVALSSSLIIGSLFVILRHEGWPPQLVYPRRP